MSEDTPAANRVTFVTIDEGRHGQRLDNFLFTHLKGVPKSRVYRIIRSGEVRINKGRAKQTTRLASGDVVVPYLQYGFCVDVADKALWEVETKRQSWM